MDSSFEASAENGDYDDEFDEYEIIDDCDQTHNGEGEEESPEEKVIAENLEPQISSQNLLPTEPVIVEGDYKNRMKEIVDRTGYKHEKSSGQHKYGGPPPNFTGPAPGPGQEVYVGKLPPDVLEDELIPMFEKCGTIYELRLMMKPQSSENKGFAFVTFMDKESAKKAHELYNDFEIRPKQLMKVNVSIPNTRLYIGNIKKSKSKDDIFEEVSKFVDGLRDVIIYSQPDTPELKNRGFAFLDFDSHKHASEAKKRLSSESFQYFLFNMNCVIEWAEPQEEPSEEEMSKVKVLYVRNLRSNVSQEDVEALFQMYGQLEKVKKIKDFCFVHFVQREDALKALEALNNKTIKDSVMSITLARPPVEQKMKEKKALLPLPVVPGSAMVGAPRVTSPLIRGIPTPHRGRGVPAPHRGRGVARGGHHHNFYDGYEGYQDDYYYDESGFDHQWGYNQPRPAAPMGRARGSMARGPLLSRPSLMRTPNASSLHPPPKPLMGGIPPKSGMPRLKTPFASPSGMVASVGQEASLKRKAHDNIFGVDNPSKQVKSEVTSSYGEQNTMAQNQTVKKESWETLPIAQKPLSQMMMDFGEQWF